MLKFRGPLDAKIKKTGSSLDFQVQIAAVAIPCGIEMKTVFFFHLAYNSLAIFLKKTRSEVKVTVTHKWYKTLHHSKMHSHTKIGIPI